MHVVHVHVHVTPGSADAFAAASLANARASVQEPGVLRFDVLADQADPHHFVLVEVYVDADEAPAAHKATEHYATWRDTVAPMMAQPRSAARFSALFPAEPSRWDTPQA